MDDLAEEAFCLGHGLVAQHRVSLSAEQRRRHIYCLGQTGTGKTTFLKSLFLQDVWAGRGASFIDPHGDAALEIAEAIPPHRINDVIWLDPSDDDCLIGFNPLENVPVRFRSLAVSSLLACFQSQWSDSWGPRLQYILRHCLTALIEAPDECHHTLLSVPRMLTEERFRLQTVRHVHDPVCAHFWREEFSLWDKRQRAEAIAPILNKAGAYASHAMLRTIIGQAHSSLRISELMNENKILIANLSKGTLGDDGVSLLGALLVSGYQQAAYRRAALPELKRVDHCLYIDEFQSFSSPTTFASLFSETRKYRLSLILSHQFLDQLHDGVLKAVLGNVGTLAVFGVGHRDAERLQLEFDPFNSEALLNSACGEFMLRTRHKGMAVAPIKVRGLQPGHAHNNYQKIRQQTIRRYVKAKNRSQIEARIAAQYRPNRVKL